MPMFCLLVRPIPALRTLPRNKDFEFATRLPFYLPVKPCVKPDYLDRIGLFTCLEADVITKCVILGQRSPKRVYKTPKSFFQGLSHVQ
ncbi:hypothetical protein SCLCIDRAFT_1222340 [Scleroderma citrinum Foug A]|uniref:Uncharacterized protein n=1 Tax=Scleroderma citrinum Foug A TaxID=1036808 RepID=A0A0C2YWP3_9AGAM|nr:hypothetical protein SCLCIDRAFT_1222340 [Scleroderma citrinum Foug A]